MTISFRISLSFANLGLNILNSTIFYLFLGSFSVAVVVAFFVCWAPFHAQRLFAVYAQGSEGAALSIAYTVVTYVSGVFYYLSTTINPLLYNLMSNKFREAFKVNTHMVNDCFRKMNYSLSYRITKLSDSSSHLPYH